jgi:DMSO/TMAO reductase YedYZ molybdopterin-dependent catalytic subunit
VLNMRSANSSTHNTAPAGVGTDAVACSRGRDPRLVVVSEAPLNAETMLAAHTGVVTPTAAFYVRNHFSVPDCTTAQWRLAVAGEVETPLELEYEALRMLPSRTLTVTLECAGNGRAAMWPRAEGEPWQYGAVSTAEWTGVPMRTVMEAAGLTHAAREIVVEGADRGYVAAANRAIPFARSLPLEQALHPDTLLAYAMNGEPLAPEHGFPVRLIVPGWYGVAAVKWVVRIEAIAHSFRGFYQVERYIMAHPERSESAATPLTRIGVRSLITTPADGASLPRGRHMLRGLAWSGAGPVRRVEVSSDCGATWEPATWTSEPTRYAWRTWEYVWHVENPGEATLQSRAFDEAGHSQPSEPIWNRLGYANNAIQAVHVVVA